MRVCVRVFMWACLHTSLWLCVYVCMCVRMCVRVCARAGVCVTHIDVSNHPWRIKFKDKSTQQDRRRQDTRGDYWRSLSLVISRPLSFSTPQHTTTNHNTTQHTATHRNTPQHTATHRNTPQHTASHHNTPHLTAIHYNLLQDTITRMLIRIAWMWPCTLFQLMSPSPPPPPSSLTSRPSLMYL